MGIFDFLFEQAVEEEVGSPNDNQHVAPVAQINPGQSSPSENEDVEKFVLKFRQVRKTMSKLSRYCKSWIHLSLCKVLLILSLKARQWFRMKNLANSK